MIAELKEKLMFIVIVNSYSGQRRYKKVIKQLEKKLSAPFFPYFSDQYQGEELWIEVTKKLDKYEKQINGIIVVGGDGTLHQVVNRFYTYHLTFGLIASGSGNDFGRALKIPKGISKAIQRINDNKAQKYDLLEVNGKKVLSVVGVGVDAETAIQCQTSKLKKVLNRAFIGRLTYLIVLFQCLRYYKPVDLEVIDDKNNIHKFQRVWLMAGGNTTFYGGGIPICPNANPQDGVIEYVVIHRLPLYQTLIKALPAVLVKMHPSVTSCVSTLSGTEFKITAINHHTAVQGDGEKIGKTPAHIKILPKAIRIY
ncbi:diacylglycerol/lipid kinase family protein [Bacillus alkalicola]|uniref:YegS/Rv2252/BmrU family lipid kinase n=2 Tax=Bacillaceae TaxID=186817 RepID=A0ABS6JU74_9BACI|nr:YegS/Rv2252/BmrU family lipid kinase [Bacillus alkalicola]MBU9722091.1 YegS/Rv2252/BmrU family lipid kinase [Bacillus alkalicola]